MADQQHLATLSNLAQSLKDAQATKDSTTTGAGYGYNPDPAAPLELDVIPLMIFVNKILCAYHCMMVKWVAAGTSYAEMESRAKEIRQIILDNSRPGYSLAAIVTPDGGYTCPRGEVCVNGVCVPIGNESVSFD